MDGELIEQITNIHPVRLSLGALSQLSKPFAHLP